MNPIDLSKSVCFVAGTLVHAKEGLIPIEKIKVGDWVLSRPESGMGTTAFKQVTATFVLQAQAVRGIVTFPKTELDRAKREGNFVRRETKRTVVVTDSHPFWVKGTGWMIARDLRDDDELVLCSGETVLVNCNNTVHKTETLDVGWFNGSWDRPTKFQSDDDGFRVDFRGAAPTVDYENYAPNAEVDWLRTPGNELLKTVYNFHVEEYRTYFVGDAGIWAHTKKDKFAGQ